MSAPPGLWLEDFRRESEEPGGEPPDRPFRWLEVLAVACFTFAAGYILLNLPLPWL